MSKEDQLTQKREMAEKVMKINQIANNPDRMKSLTGFGDGAPGGDLTRDLFILVALLELYSTAYLDADCYFSQAQQASTTATGFMPRDRLLTYL